MLRTRCFRLGTGLFALLTAIVSLAPAADGKIELRTVKYDGLVKEIRAQKGKIIIVDVWAQYCVPCKKEFPHLVAMQKKYGDKGLVAISVSLDDVKDQESRTRAVEFLEKVKANDVINLLLDEEAEVWQAKFKIDGPPVVYVFDRDNRIVLKMPVGDTAVDYAVIEQKVQELLKK